MSDVKEVAAISWHGPLKRVRLCGGATLTVPLSACVTQGDPVRLTDDGAWVVCHNGEAQITPLYIARERLRVGDLNLELVIKEITEAAEFAAYQSLSQFHYRGHVLYGRTARLIVRSFHPLYPQIIGYVELATPLYMNKARSLILDAPFRANGVAWDAWDMPITRKYIHLVVRVARCVVYPEFRGLGLGQMLVRHAAEFARQRWQVTRLMPYFLEISADMLKYVPLAVRAGLIYVGETEGNLQRVAKDMEYLLRNRGRVKAGEIVKETACGIVDRQVARMDRAWAVMEEQGLKLEEFIARLQRLSRDTILRDLELFREIVSLPKPTYLGGLVPEAEAFVRERAAAVAPPNGHTAPPLQLEPLSSSVAVAGVSLKYDSRVRRTRRTLAIQQAFGISPRTISHPVVRDLSLTLKPGEVILVTGPSGSGKTTLLRLLAERGHPGMSGTVKWPDNYQPGTFAPIRSQKALVELLGVRGIRAALQLMSRVGLSDAFVYLKRFDELSNGQKYRAMLAQLITSECNVWLADEFCASLDPVTANVVAHHLQRTARELGATLIVATSQPQVFAAALKPDQVVQLTSSWDHKCIPGHQFVRSLPSRGVMSTAPMLDVSRDYLTAIRCGRKRTTIRKGRKSFQNGLLLLNAKTDIAAVNVTNLRITRLRCLTEQDGRDDGFDSLTDLHRALRGHYPDLRENSWVTVVTFEPICGLPPSPGRAAKG